VASFRMFEAGLFSSDPSRPWRTDAAGLMDLEESRMARGFQASAANPLAGLDGRVGLLKRLGRAMKSAPHLFDALRGRATQSRLEAPIILEVVLEALEEIWPERIELDGVGLGDTWPHPAAAGSGPSAGLVPLHKLSQWLAYSLVEPLEEAGLSVSGLDQLTGLAEYRNGGLFVDLDVLVPKHPDVIAVTHAPESEVVVEWRALTVALLDRLAPLVGRARGAGRDRASPDQGPGRRHLGGGARAGRRPACRSATDSSRERRHVVLTGRHRMSSRVHVIDHPLVQHKLSLMRMKSTSTSAFRNLLTEVSVLLAYEVTRDMPTHQVTVDTPLARTSVPMLDGKKIVLISILRAGTGILDGILRLIPSARVGHVGLYRDPKTLTAVEYYFKVPREMSDRDAIVVDPMLATGNSAVAAVERLRETRPRSIKFVCLLTCPEGLKNFHSHHPDVPVYTAAIDSHLDEHGYIIPGLGDAGDRLYGTK